MKFSTNKERGDSGLGIAIAYFTTNGYTISITLNDTQDYDLVIEKGNKSYAIQVKATGFKTRHEIYQIALKSCIVAKYGENNTKNIKFVYKYT